MRLVLLTLACVLGTGCFSAWSVGGPWACTDAGACSEGFTCDDGVCCKPDGTPRCPTLPFEGTCPFGSTPATYFRDNDHDGAGALATGRVFRRAPVTADVILTSLEAGRPMQEPLTAHI